MTTLLTSPTATPFEREPAPRHTEPHQSTRTGSGCRTLATTETDYFSAQLRSAVPFDRETEYAVTSRVEQLSQERIATILGFPIVFSELFARVADHLHSRNGSRELCSGDRTLERFSDAAAALKDDLLAVKNGVLSPTEYGRRLDQLGKAVATDAALATTRFIGSAAIERYRRLIEPEFHQSARSSSVDTHPSTEQLVLDARRTYLRSIEEERTRGVDCVIRANLRLVYAVSARFRVHQDLREELIAAGNVALTRCAHDFKASLGFRFSTYAFKSINHAMVEILTEHSRHNRTTSLNRPVSNGEDSAELIHMIADPTSTDPHEAVEAKDRQIRNRTVIAHALAELPADERAVLERYFGLNGRTTHSIPTIAAELDRNAAQIRACLERGKLRLRRSIPAFDEWSAVPADAESESAAIEPPLRGQPLSRNRPWNTGASNQGKPAEQTPSIDSIDTGRNERLAASPELLALTEAYTTELTRIRRSAAENPPDTTRTNTCLDQLRCFHESLAQRWPLGAAEKRYGFQLEGEMLALKQTLTHDQISALASAIERFSAGIEALRTEPSSIPNG